MAHLPTVAIIGRPNTGKSTLFNRLVGRRQAIVSEQPGTTRDHIASTIETPEVDYLLIDTGGMGGGSMDTELEADVEAQSILAVEHADLILFTINSREDLTASDYAVTSILRKRRKRHVPVILVITKCDNLIGLDVLLPQYHQLGIGDDVIPVSAIHTLGIEELQETIIEKLRKLHFQKLTARSSQLEAPRVAVIGQPNVGKSSLINALMSDADRETSPRLVAETPGTTRDASDVTIRSHGKEYVFIDTAGLRRHPDTPQEIEGLAVLRTIQAIEHADITILLLEAVRSVTRQDKRIVSMVIEEGKGLILALNKIDVLSHEQRTEKLSEVRRDLFFCAFAPVLPCSALTREGIEKLFDLIEMAQRNRTRQLSPENLRQWFSEALQGHPMGALARTHAIEQVRARPPTFELFVRDPKKVQLSDLRFLERRLRSTFGFEGTPIRWITQPARAAAFRAAPPSSPARPHVSAGGRP